jgi:outer membrane protein assembly factor BamD (BamD/ComL family)
LTAAVTHRRRALGALGLALVAGCSSLNARTAPAPDKSWPAALATAQSDAGQGKFDAADSVLADFATRFPGSPEAAETAYWRALLRMDPTNPHQSLSGAMAGLDGYLTDTRPRRHVTEATTIRRAAGQLDGLNKLAASAVAQAKDATITAKDAKAQAADAAAAAAAKATDVPPSADAEIKRLKDELAKANAELDRIRKRLTQPPPKSP